MGIKVPAPYLAFSVAILTRVLPPLHTALPFWKSRRHVAFWNGGEEGHSFFLWCLPGTGQVLLRTFWLVSCPLPAPLVDTVGSFLLVGFVFPLSTLNMLWNFVTVFMVSDEEPTHHPSDPSFVHPAPPTLPFTSDLRCLHHSLGPLPSSLRFFLSVLQIDCF